VTETPVAAWRRAWPADLPDLAGYPALAAARAYSCRTNAELADLLAALDGEPGFVCLAVAGSLGRLEAMPDSDCDLIAIVEPGIGRDSREARRLLERAWDLVAPRNLKRPKSWGIFTETANEDELTDPRALGDLGDDLTLYGKRMQLIMDAQPVFGDAAFFALQRRLVAWFATASTCREPEFPGAYLLGEAVRYYRTYSAWQQFKLTVEEDENWSVRELKLRFSRRLMYAGLVLALVDAWSGPDPRPAFAAALPATPLERVCRAAGDAAAREVLGVYERFQAAMNDAHVRACLISEGPTSLAELETPPAPTFAPLAAAAADFGDLVSALILEHLGRAPAPVRRAFMA